MNKKAIITFVLFCAYFTAAIFRLWTLQVRDAGKICERYSGLGTRKGGRVVLRGTIYDRNGMPLAVSIMKYNLIVNGAIGNGDDLSEACDKISAATGLSKSSVAGLVRKNSMYNIIAKGITPESREKILGILSGSPKKNVRRMVYFEEAGERIYLENNTAHQIVGRCDRENKGLYGMEMVYNDILTGNAAEDIQMIDASGEPIFRKSGQLRDISDIYLTLDKNIQYHCEEISQKYLPIFKADSIVIIVQDISTGEILGWSQRLSSKKHNDINTGYSTSFEPGSTFKIFIAALAMQKNSVDLNTPLFCENGKWKVYDIEIKDHEPYGTLTFKSVFARSSNIGMAKIGMRLSPDDFYRNILNFGFGSKTGIELPAEARGFVPRPDSKTWSGVTQYTISYGQGMNCNALQMVNAVSCIANAGRLLRPQLVYKITDCTGRAVVSAEPDEIRRAVPENIAKKVSELMYYSVNSEEATGKNARIPGIKVAGKTGTAQKTVAGRRGYVKGKYVANFAGFFPFDNPRISIYVIVDEPGDRYYGGDVAAPIFAEVGSKIVSLYGMDQPSLPTRMAALK